ncbi:MAG: heme A synthase [Rhodospirillaceae bacterium]|jgi:cytochrome c oxidase assembly protein subunit 15|nr:heme A synthase [Rhodospirillaceae bacterium]MBT3495202.1 heme A synthase [Rhodospirillaceae bacterium]MBT3781068.1 heme A synthase [Rhodospirillaceae bacterium]MBT3977398.1 heme A synthase [Rhodospirillaceae bacterium]MBT4565028.1 heme A synthase [Rhodospirillaceae bacterium]
MSGDQSDAGEARAIGARPQVAIWLLVVAAMVVGMVMLGGATRLTHSGLSMVQWQPLMGILPPLSEEAWQETFEKYQQYPEYKKINQGMTLPEFKGIFYYEYSHRVLGRGIGLVFALPFLWFLLTGRVERRRRKSLLGLFLLGGLQGLIGWWMVKSGLVDRPDVSQYRLTVHLGVAFLILGGLIWVALDLLSKSPAGNVVGDVAGRAAGALRGWAWAAVLLVLLQALSGGLVAGLDAGFVYNTFPMMNEYWLPPELGELSPWWLNMFENVITVQFDHRIGAYLCTLLLIWIWFKARLLDLDPAARLALRLSLAALVLQLALGIATLVLLIPVSLAVLHQGGALLLFAATVQLAYRLRAS